MTRADVETTVLDIFAGAGEALTPGCARGIPCVASMDNPRDVSGWSARRMCIVESMGRNSFPSRSLLSPLLSAEQRKT
jgi:hypothetical protein